MNKATLRIPSSIPYAYIEVLVEGSMEEIINTFIEYTHVLKTKESDQRTNQEAF